MSPADRSPSLLEASRAFLATLGADGSGDLTGTLALDVERAELEAFRGAVERAELEAAELERDARERGPRE